MDDADPRCAMLLEMTASAHRLGIAFAAEAERADETGRKIEYFKLFDRCFFAVRVGIALELRLRREARSDAARVDRDDPSDLAERDPLEDERPERPERSDAQHPVRDTDRDRDREVERATLPLLLDTLQGVAADACALRGPPPGELLTLRDLLARYAADTAQAPRPDAGQTRRARLAGSAAAFAANPAANPASGQVMTRPWRSPSRDVASSPFRPATGPPPG